MFFIFGISSKEEKIDFNQTSICPTCESFGRYELFMTYTHFSLFFIPIIKWNKKYYVRMSCCKSLYTIDKELGKDIERGVKTSIQESDLIVVKANYNRDTYCPSCDYKLRPEFDYCPSCGRKL